MKVQSYRDLIAWQRAMALVREVYTLTKVWPRDEMFCLTSQVRRAAISIPSNIAEGQGRKGTKEFLNHLSIAYGSLMELETQLLIASGQEYVSEDQLAFVLHVASEVGRLINGLSNSLTTDH